MRAGSWVLIFFRLSLQQVKKQKTGEMSKFYGLPKMLCASAYYTSDQKVVLSVILNYAFYSHTVSVSTLSVSTGLPLQRVNDVVKQLEGRKIVTVKNNNIAELNVGKLEREGTLEVGYMSNAKEWRGSDFCVLS